MGETFPEITVRVSDLKEILNEEETSFAKTLDRGEKLFADYLVKTTSSGKSVMSGADVWRLYDTYGFPVDLTRLMAEESGLTIDEEEFEREQQQARERSRKTKDTSGGDIVLKLDVHDLGKIEKQGIKPTNDSFKYGSDITAKIIAIHLDGNFVDSVAAEKNGGRFGIVLDRTCFYAEQGGQMNDTGNLSIDGQVDFAVEDVQVFGGYVLHIGYLKFGSLSLADEIVCSFDELRRWPLRNNHTATHLINHALRTVLGSVVDQKGSLVAPEKFRFDYACKAAPTVAELEKVEDLTNAFVKANHQLYFKDVPLEDAKKINGLRAVFGEVYPDPVRVVSVGFDVDEMLKDPSNEKWKAASIEFCGGT